MKTKYKIRGWIIVIIGIAIGYGIAPVLTILGQNFSKPNLLVMSSILGMVADFIILFGVIVGIINFFRKRSAKKDKTI